MGKLSLAIAPAMTGVLLCCAGMFVSCVEKFDPIPAIDESVVMPVDPTTDQMEVNVTADLPTSAISTFDDNSMASALLKRIPQKSAVISPDTRFVLLKGDDLLSITNETWRDIALVYLRGGFVAIERPTNERLFGFTFGLMVAVDIMLEELLVGNGDTAATALSADLQRRIFNASALTKGAAGDDDDPLAPEKVSMEMLILSSSGIYSQTALNEEREVTHIIMDEDGEETEEVAIVKNKLDAYHYGQLADGAATWLNQRALGDEGSRSAETAFTKGGSLEAINEAMACTDEFTISYPLNVTDLDGVERAFENKGLTVVKAWSLHDFDSNQDFYFVEEKIHVALGGKNDDASKTLYWGPYEADKWHKVNNDNLMMRQGLFGGYIKADHSYGSWLFQTHQSMRLQGNGTIKRIAFANNPAAGNNPSTESIPVTSESNWVLGHAAAADINGGFDFGYNTSTSTSHSNAFSITKSTIDKKELKYTEIGAGMQYTPAKIRGRGEGFQHPTHPDLFTKDFDYTNTACWRVSDPSEQYTLKLDGSHVMATYFIGTSHSPITGDAALTGTSVITTFALKQPGRYMENWHCQINPEGKNMVADASAKLRRRLQETIHPVPFEESFNMAEVKRGETSVMAKNFLHIKSLLQEDSQLRGAIETYAKELGIESVGITWQTDDPTTESFRIADLLLVGNELNDPTDYNNGGDPFAF